MHRISSILSNGECFPKAVSPEAFFTGGAITRSMRVMLRNRPQDLAVQLRDKEEGRTFAPALPADYGEIGEDAVDAFDAASFSDFVRIRDLPGGGSLLEITLLPQENGELRFCPGPRSICCLPRGSPWAGRISPGKPGHPSVRPLP
ncbi:MAG: hypothetical protein U5N26_02085 [Candidatus Marinimicrobia bacterium]|nr:hypothetical protein [Candidatus Neomarinimicrobiota bacterium]